MKILIVEDDHEILKLMHIVLSDTLHHEVLGVHDVTNARDSIDSFMPDIILLDLVMDGENPIDFVYYLRKQYPSIQVILVSASSKLKSVASNLSVPYLAKPFAIDDLNHIILTSRKSETMART